LEAGLESCFIDAVADKEKRKSRGSSSLVNLTEQAAGKAFQILSAPETLTAKLDRPHHRVERQTPAGYEYFYFDNAFYRKRADSRLSSVDDVWFDTGWTPYEGDRQEKYMFGDRIDVSALPDAARDR
jgi:hypothetical protein